MNNTTNTDSSAKTPNALRRCWSALRRPSVKWSVLTLLVVGFFGGIFFWGAFNTGMEATNQLEFCVGCHEMHDNVYQEYKQTIHYSNRSGVRAICSDCHVPHDWTHKIIRKIQASQEVWSKITGYVDTPEKFNQHRMEMATKEWERMKSVGSRECRNCHNFDAMSEEAQGKANHDRHMQARDNGQTCIDCHKGIAHHLPKEYRDPNEE
jgi:cytochrome c-type protein NapC